ncbi:MAG: cyclic beta 1-2 glucan synthetase, partial [Chitinophagales bacterium]|nr:cyclic beta 1-2 glucan synthetase [Chitinophagales bacterium]
LLNEEAFAGVPRVYDIAFEIISHSDGRLDIDLVNKVLGAYQQISVLRLGELWAVPIMFRLSIIENLRRIASRIAVERNQRDLADYWAKEMVRTAETERQKIILVIADMARSNPPLERAFVAELIRQLRGRSSTLIQALNWIEDRLNETGHTLSEMVQADNQKQASDQLTISNCINSLRALNNIDWRDFVEYNSAVEKILRTDNVYCQLDFATRDHYRHVVEHMGKHSKFTETAIAETAIKLAEADSSIDRPAYERHVGYYLIDDGLIQLEQLIKVKYVVGERIRKALLRWPLTVYLLPVLVVTALITVGVVEEVAYVSDSKLLMALLAIITVISSSQLAVSLANFCYTLWVKPVLLPKMDYAEGIPEESKTLVIVPSMLISMEEVETLVEALEVRFIANKNEHLYFGLLTDYKDAATETLQEDDELLGAAIGRISALNSKYAEDGKDIFFLFHRPRQWNKAEGVWMGYERKRGKLGDLNNFLQHGDKSAFDTVIGDTDLLTRVKYVITLDSDTQLPRSSAAKIVAAMAHPLNRAVYDEQKQRVVRGYGILQPRVSVSMPHADSSEYARLNGNEPGIDPYTRATSDVYQDLFKEGSFIGKGIYDVEVFERALKGRFPDNRILSHDLLEGCYTRAGLLSDVQLYEKYPARYSADMKRRHRWIRGDWQIAAWFLPWVPDAQHHWKRNPLSALGRWKIFDNIRRSFYPIAVTLLILLGWFLLPLAGWWTLLVSGIIIFPPLVSSLWTLFNKSNDTVFTHHLILATRAAGSTAVSTLFTLICLPYEAIVNIDAIFRTTWRMLISKKHLLEWNPSNLTDKLGSNSLFYYYFTMKVEPLLAIGAGFYLYFFAPAALMAAGPVLLLWVIVPSVTWLLSQPSKVKAAKLNLEQRIFLQKSGRKIWAFFDDLVNEKENWLPPDNIQEEPSAVIAHRTSPTNIGMALLANLSAYDLGYITAGQLLQRCNNTFTTLGRMERFKGHYYNWYDTQTLEPLNPRYISTVDSGNLLGHVLTLKQGIEGIAADKIISENFFEGLRTVLRLLADVAGRNQFSTIKKFKTELELVLKKHPENLPELYRAMLTLKTDYIEIVGGLKATENSATNYWHNALQKQLDAAVEELLFVAPWLTDLEGAGKFIELING